MFKGRYIVLALCWPVLAAAGDSPDGQPDQRPSPSLSVDLTAGAASTFQLPLGGSFGDGPAIQDTLTASLNSIFQDGDALSVFGWSTTDVPSSTPNWQAGAIYSMRLLRRGRHSLTLSAGAQRWVLPSVGSGAKDWLTSENLTYGTRAGGVSLFVSETSWSLLKSTLPTGSAVYTQVYAQHRLVNRRGFQLLLREGPAHSYSWDFYGLQGNCAFHYGGWLVAVWKGNSFSAGYRRQFGLQDSVPNSNYWEFSLTRPLLKVAR